MIRGHLEGCGQACSGYSHAMVDGLVASHILHMCLGLINMGLQTFITQFRLLVSSHLRLLNGISMALKINLQGGFHVIFPRGNAIPLRLSDAYSISCANIEWAMRVILGEDWLIANPFAPTATVVSRLATMVMDLSYSTDFTKLVIGSFFHTSLYIWEELNS
ncbi:hypothetical protein SUGI_0319760 [Cryptomeria japonica]|nr:hypothetical protein SUGI_0319760 [Cryptomeria japonica]